MGLLEFLFGAAEGVPEEPERPKRVAVRTEPLCVYAPVAGEVIPTSEIPDPIFASGAMGATIGIKPREGIAYAPVTGTITVTAGTLHAVGLRSDDGLEVLVHLGVDTVDMLGDGFTGFVSKGQHVHAGEALIAMDLDRISAAGYSDVVIMAVTNAADFDTVDTVVQDGALLEVGERVMTCGSRKGRS